MTDYDFLVTNFFHSFSNYQLDFFLTVVTNFAYVFLAYFLLRFLLKKQRNRFYMLIVSGIIGLGAVIGLKYLINRPRPFPISNLGLLEKTDPSFPSNHAFLAALGIYFLPKDFSKKIKTLFQIYFLLIVPLSSLVSGVHYITDIAAGMLIGYLLPLALDKILGNKIFVKRSK